MKFYWNPLYMPRWVRLITAIVLYVPCGWVFGTIIGVMVGLWFGLILGAVPTESFLNGLGALVTTFWVIFVLWFIFAKRRVPLQEKKDALFTTFEKDCENAEWKDADPNAPILLTDRR